MFWNVAIILKPFKCWHQIHINIVDVIDIDDIIETDEVINIDDVLEPHKFIGTLQMFWKPKETC
jgi:hypothetical protein